MAAHSKMQSRNKICQSSGVKHYDRNPRTLQRGLDKSNPQAYRLQVGKRRALYKDSRWLETIVNFCKVSFPAFSTLNF
jgi:hypothetical protein